MVPIQALDYQVGIIICAIFGGIVKFLYNTIIMVPVSSKIVICLVMILILFTYYIVSTNKEYFITALWVFFLGIVFTHL